MERDATLQREHLILSLLAASDGPVGSGVLWQELQRRGQPMSEPTVGRWLRWLDVRGYTAKVSNLGRTLTAAGRRRLAELDEHSQRTESETELLQTIRPATIDDILDVLVARRAIEREIARLAAAHATEQDLATLHAIVERQRRQLAETGDAVEEDIAFHNALAAIAGNRVLAAALRLIRQDRVLQRTLDAIRRRRGSRMVVDHLGIIAALRTRDPEAAERAMLDHVNRLIEEVVAYRREMAPGKMLTGVSAGHQPGDPVLEDDRS